MQSLAPKVEVIRRSNGELILTSGYALGEVPINLATLMTEQARRNPDRPIIAEKNAAGQFEPVTYGEAHQQAMGIATYLIDQEAGVDQPVMILSGASRAHFVVQMGACYAGVPVVPVSTSYTSVAAAFPKFEAVFNKTQPAFLFAVRFSQSVLDNADDDLVWDELATLHIFFGRKADLRPFDDGGTKHVTCRKVHHAVLLLEQLTLRAFAGSRSATDDDLWRRLRSLWQPRALHNSL